MPQRMMSSETQPVATRPNTNQVEVDLDRTFHRIYKAYGPNLATFFEAARQQQRRDCNPESNSARGGRVAKSR